MKKPFHISILLTMTTLFVGTIVWQNFQNQKLISEILRKENKTYFSELAPEVKQENFEPVSLSHISQVQAAGTANTTNKSNSRNPNDTIFNVLNRLYYSGETNNVGYNFRYNTTIDINGDGLIDVLYHYYHKHTSRRNYEVYLNNGNGFDRTYYCYYDGTYTGDCADPDKPL